MTEKTTASYDYDKTLSEYIQQPKVYISILLLLLIIYSIMFKQFFPNNNGNLGHDYYYFFTRLLAGFYWFKENGLFSIPYFTPSLCGGNVFFTDPQNLYYSLPQFLTFIVNPLNAIRITFVIFAAAGMAGTFLLLRKTFSSRVETSLLGAALFLFNGFYTYRIIVGHLTYHGFMLLPFIYFFLLPNKNQEHTFIKNAIFSASAAFLFSYIFYSGGAHIIIPSILSIFAAALIYRITCGSLQSFPFKFSLFLIIVILLTSSKLTAGLYTLKHLARDGYPMPVISSVTDSLFILIKSLFFIPAEWEQITKLIINPVVILGRHEFEFGITLIPLILILIGFCKSFLKHWKEDIKFEHKIDFALLLFILLIPIVFNSYIPIFYDALKQIPIIKSSVTLLRWYSLYIPIAIIAAAIFYERLKFDPNIKAVSCIILIVFIICFNFFTNKNYYKNQSYSPTVILNAYQTAKNNDAEIPYIKYADTQCDVGHYRVVDDSMMTFGVSNINCYESLFGYRHEFFPKKNKFTFGDIYRIKDGYFNMKNPACYTYPEVNSCEVGDNFRADQREELKNFAHYKQFTFNIPAIQKAANIITIITLICSLGFIMLYGVLRIKNKL